MTLFESGPLKLRIAERIHVPAQRPARGRKRHDLGRIERGDQHDDGRQGHEAPARPPRARRLITRLTRASQRLAPPSRPKVRMSATAAKAALPGQLKASRARSLTTLAIILTRPPPSNSGVAKALKRPGEHHEGARGNPRTGEGQGHPHERAPRPARRDSPRHAHRQARCG